MTFFRQSLLNHFWLWSLPFLLPWSPRCRHLASRSTANAVGLVISGSHPNHSMSLDAGVFWVLPKVVCRFSGRNSFFLQMVMTWFVDWNVVGSQLGRPTTRNGSHIAHVPAPQRHRELSVKIDYSSPPIVLHPFHMCLNVKMCAFKSMKYACLSSYKGIVATHLILPSVLLFCW